MFSRQFRAGSGGNRWPGFMSDERIEIGLDKEENQKILELEIDTGTALYEWYSVPALDGRRGGIVTYIRPYYDFSFSWLNLGDMYADEDIQHQLLALFLYVAHKASTSLDGVRRNVEFLMLARKLEEEDFLPLVRNAFSLGLSPSHYLGIIRRITADIIKQKLSKISEDVLIKDPNYVSLESVDRLSDFVATVARLVSTYPELSELEGSTVFRAVGTVSVRRSSDRKMVVSFIAKDVKVQPPQFSEDAYKSTLAKVVTSFADLPEWVDIRQMLALDPVVKAIYEKKNDMDFVQEVIKALRVGGYRAVRKVVLAYDNISTVVGMVTGDPLPKAGAVRGNNENSEGGSNEKSVGDEIGALDNEISDSVSGGVAEEDLGYVDTENNSNEDDVFSDLLGDVL